MTFREVVTPEVVQAIPTGAVGGAILWGVPLSDIVLYVTLTVAVLQGAFTVYKWKVFRAERKSPTNSAGLSGSVPIDSDV
jgi:hypothetical protein